MNSLCETSDLLVFSHLRWDYIFQRQLQVLSRYAKHRRVYFIEEAILGVTNEPRLYIKTADAKLNIIVPYLPNGLSDSEVNTSMRLMLDELLLDEDIENFTTFYYSPKPLIYSSHLKPSLIFFDCMDDERLLSNNELINKSNYIFTSSQSLHEDNSSHQYNLHLLPDSFEFAHFEKSRVLLNEPHDQINIPHPRIGYYGVVDEKFNLKLLDKMSDLRPEFQFIIMGPVVGIDSSTLPKKPNIHYLGKKDFQSLPFYLSSWDCAFMPYAHNDATRFTSPTKTAELLASGTPVVSTSIFNVVHPYADAKLIHIADHPEHFVECIEKAINESNYDPEWLERVDQFLEGKSWDSTFKQIADLEMDAKKMVNKRYIPAHMDSALLAIGIV